MTEKQKGVALSLFSFDPARGLGHPARGPRAPRPRPRHPARALRAHEASGTPPEASGTPPEPQPRAPRPKPSGTAPEGPTASNTPPEGLAHTARRPRAPRPRPSSNSRKVSGTLPDASALGHPVFGHPEASGRPDRCPTTPSELAMPEPSTSSVILSLPLLHY